MYFEALFSLLCFAPNSATNDHFIDLNCCQSDKQCYTSRFSSWHMLIRQTFIVGHQIFKLLPIDYHFWANTGVHSRSAKYQVSSTSVVSLCKSLSVLWLLIQRWIKQLEDESCSASVEDGTESTSSQQSTSSRSTPNPLSGGVCFHHQFDWHNIDSWSQQLRH